MPSIKSMSGLWAGDEESLAGFLQATAKWEATTPEAAGIVSSNKSSQGNDDDVKSRLLSVANGVGLISIKGRLVSEDTWWNRYAGNVSYSEIREAALEALLNPNVHEVLLDIASPGGHVAGIQDANDVLLALGAVKRLTAYTDSVAASGGYWLYSTARDRFASPIASVGSIGVIQIHMEYTKQMLEDGITPTVLRAGKYKALGNPYEKLTKLAVDETEDKLNHVYGVFVQSVADNLKTSYQAVDSHMAQGRVFVGTQAVDAGLIDSVSNFDKVYATIVNRVAKKGDLGMPSKSRITQGALQAAAAVGGLSHEELQAALAVDNGSADVKSEDASKADVKSDDASKADVKSEDTSKAEVKSEDTSKADVKSDDTPGVEAKSDDTPEVEAKSEDAPEPSALDLLKTQLADANEKLVDLKVELKGITAEKEALADAVTPLKVIVAQATNGMSVALNQAPDDKLAEVDTSTLLKRHKEVATLFSEQFKVGGVGSPAASGDAESKNHENASELSAFEKAKLAASSKIVKLAR